MFPLWTPDHKLNCMRSACPLSGIFIAAIVTLAVTACDSRHEDAPRFSSYSNLYSVGNAINWYNYDHHKPPPRLSDLVPTYIPLDRIGIFYVTNKWASNPSKPRNWESDASLVDKFSSYTYLGPNGSHGVLAFEKFGLWKPGNPKPDQLAVLFTDLHAEYVPVAVLQKVLSGETSLKRAAQ